MKNLILITLLLISASCTTTSKKFKVIAHRSASGYLPEHTLPGVALAHGFDIDYIEPDIVLTRDNIPVILHDIHLDTTTNVAKLFPKRKRRDGRFYAIDFSLKEIKKLNVFERTNLKTKKMYFKDRFDSRKLDLKVPTLEQFITLVQGLNRTRHRDIGIYPEIKSPKFHRAHKKDISKIVLKTLAKYGYKNREDNIYLQCFDPIELKRLRQELKVEMKLVQLIGENSWGESDADYDYLRSKKGLVEISKYADGIGPRIQHIITMDLEKYKITSLVDDAHKLNLEVHPYTHRLDQLPGGFSSQKLINVLKNEGKVDGVFSDFSDRVRD
jgi:glycerophosphoryl diester phosphodiesterase